MQTNYSNSLTFNNNNNIIIVNSNSKLSMNDLPEFINEVNWIVFTIVN